MNRNSREFKPKRVTFYGTPNYRKDFSIQQSIVPKPFFRACDRYDTQTMNSNGRPKK